jgi:ferredoxin
MPKKDKSKFSHFFKEDAKAVQDIFKGQTDPQSLTTLEISKKEEFPIISSSTKASEDEFNAYWLRLRSFFRTANNAEGLTNDLTPVIMAPLYTQSKVVSDFPVWVAGTQLAHNAECCLSLNEILTNALNAIAPGENDAPILKDTLERILHLANDLGTDTKPCKFPASIAQILKTLESELDVTGEEGKAFSNDLKNLKNALPIDGFLLPYSVLTSFQLLEAATVTSLARARKNLLPEIEELKSKLQDLLRIEEDKNPGKNPLEGKSVTLEFADSIVNFEEISTMAPDSGTVSLGEERLKRINRVVKNLEEALTTLDQKALIIADETLYRSNNIDSENLFENATIEIFTKGNGVNTIAACFKQNIADWTRLYVAKRVGELELNSNYLPEIHDDYFEHFDWKNFSLEELNSVPHFILIADEKELFESELNQLSSMLSDNIPVKIVSVKSDQSNGKSNTLPGFEGSGLHAHAGMGALMLSYKNIYVAQSTSITPKYLFNAFMDGLNAFAPAFFSVLNVDDKIHTHRYIRTSAAIESRDFPGFTFKGMLGTPWGSRFDVQNNPQAHAQWPVHELTVVNAEGDKIVMAFAFTYAHQAASNAAYNHYFMQVDPSYWDDKLILLTDYNKNSVEENIGKVPFIWMLDARSELYKVAVSWPVVLAMQERLDFWRFLQENSGINNYHVTQAVAQTESELQALHAHEIERLKEEHEAEIEKVRKEEAENVMENLTSVLLNLDTSHVVSTSAVSSRPAPKVIPGTDAKNKAEVETPVTEEDDSMLSNDPYIDTALCTSCNECTDLNGIMFKYNTDKMAFIADPRAGTFSELVKAAELCPVGVIHPGSPLNPSEANLDSLVIRAEKFN